MNNLIWLVRAARWARNPPSMKMVIMVFSIIAFALVLAGLEYFDLIPEWAQMEPARRGRGPMIR
ncbi:MAG: hypothetical protein Q4F71_05890 [Paracoccus sp. (in: a-proteobacteria)]|nr:hypothetical protein [Paracoccus sp. (in: a-proteobacteria)]